MSNILPSDILDGTAYLGTSIGSPCNPKAHFHLVIDYPSTEKHPEFQAQVELLDKIGGSMGLLIGTFLTTTPEQRYDDTQLEYILVDEITGFAQAFADSIDTVWNAEIGDFQCVDPSDNFDYIHASQAVFGGADEPLGAWNIARKIIPMFRYYYNHIVLPEDMDIYEDWDYDLNTFGDIAIIQFNSPDNKNIFNNLLTYI